MVNNSAIKSIGFVPSRLLLDLRGTISVIGSNLESESVSDEEEMYSMSSILVNVVLRRGNYAGNVDASKE